jgi:tetrahydromethanopterin S-methyltransferase subunit F
MIHTTISTIGGLVISVIFAFVCSAIARSKDRGPILWGILGFLFSIITLIIVLVMPRKAYGRI